MSYKGYSFNLHIEHDKDLIEWLVNKKVTQTIKIALRNQMKCENNSTTVDDSMNLLSAIKKVIESNNNTYNEQLAVVESYAAPSQESVDNKSLSKEDVEDFEKIFDM